MDPSQLWNRAQENWWWIHPLLVGIFLGGSLGIWAYRELWYGLSTFFSSPVVTRSPFRAVVQWFASFVMLFRSVIAVALMITWPLVLRNETAESDRWAAIGLAVAAWILARLISAFVFTKKPGPPTFFKRPFRWAYYHSVQTPDSLVTGWVDVFLGVLLHAGLMLIWYRYENLDDSANWERPATIAASFGLILLLTSISVLIHPTPAQHKAGRAEPE